MKIKSLVICIVSLVMMIALAAHAPTAPQVSQAAKDNMANETELLPFNQAGSFDIFTLSGPETQFSVRRPTTMIPDRPAVRSPYQPSWR